MAINDEDREQLRALLTAQRVLSLSLLVDGVPYASLMPFVTRPDLGAALVHASRLARHTRGLVDAAKHAVLIHAPDRDGADPMQLPRVTLQGEVRPIAHDSEAYVSGRSLYLAKFPGSEVTFQLGDFGLYELTFAQGRFVAGFARTVNLSAATLAELA